MLNKVKLGTLITQRREKYNGCENLPIRGVSRDGMIPPKQKEADTSLYNVFYRWDFIFNPARMELNSIILNTSLEKGICSSLYEIFYISDVAQVIPEYLNLIIKREEFARYCEFAGWGSAREYCRCKDIANLTVYLPPIDIQKKYVSIYNAMKDNLKAYQCGIADLKVVCDGYIDQLKKTSFIHRLGDYIELSEERNEDNRYNLDSVRGISIEKKFIPTKANMSGVNLSSYSIVHPGEYAYVTVTSRNGDKISLAMNDSNESYICSSSYIVFKCKQGKLNPRYLKIFFDRTEFDRYARYNSWGSARETFDWPEMCNVQLPIPPMDVQKSIADIYQVYMERQEINRIMENQINAICPILIKGSIEEAQKAGE